MIENYRTTPTRVFKISSVYPKVFGMVLCSCKHEEWRMSISRSPSESDPHSLRDRDRPAERWAGIMKMRLDSSFLNDVIGT